MRRGKIICKGNRHDGGGGELARDRFAAIRLSRQTSSCNSMYTDKFSCPTLGYAPATMASVNENPLARDFSNFKEIPQPSPATYTHNAGQNFCP